MNRWWIKLYLAYAIMMDLIMIGAVFGGIVYVTRLSEPVLSFCW